MEANTSKLIPLRQCLSLEFTITRRYLGWILLLVGGLSVAGILAIDILNAGREGGIGPAQGAALVVMALIAFIGLTLIPLKHSPDVSVHPPVEIRHNAFLSGLQRIGIGLAALVLAFSLYVYAAYAWNLINFPFDYDQGEGFELVDTILLSQGRLPYQNTEQYPFYSSNYSPLYHVIAAPFVWFFGAGHWYGRLLSFISTIVTASAIAYAINRETKQRWVAVFAGLAFLASNTIYHIGPLFRQHISMVMFETLGVVILARAFPNRQPRLIALSLLMLILAGYTKQLAAITALAMLGWMFLVNPRRAVLWGIGFAAVGGGVFLWLNIASSGEWWRQAIRANVGGISIIQVTGLFRLWFRLHGFLIIPAVLFTLYELYFARLSAYSVWFIVSALLGGIASGTWGGGDSYFATSIAALCLCSGIFIGRSLQRGWRFERNYLSRIPFALIPARSYTPLAIAFMILLPLLYLGYARATIKMPTEGAPFEQIAGILDIQPNALGRFYDSASYDVQGYAYIGHFTTPEDVAAGYQIVDAIRASEQPVLSEEAGFSLAAEREVITNPTQLLNLYSAGLYKGDELIRMINKREFGLMIMRAQFYPTPVLVAIGKHYESFEVIAMNGFEYVFYRPKTD
jgi:hypothetical protein